MCLCGFFGKKTILIGVKFNNLISTTHSYLFYGVYFNSISILFPLTISFGEAAFISIVFLPYFFFLLQI